MPEEDRDASSFAPRPATPADPANTGHGHVHPRPDGQKARCGGPGPCAQCTLDQQATDRTSEITETVKAGVWVCFDDEGGRYSSVTVHQLEIDALRESQKGGYYRYVKFLEYGQTLTN
jgi:hypothetical protein